MEKYKNLVRIEEMKNLLAEGNYRRALEIAQQIDIRKLKKSSELNLVYDVYMRNSRYERARACVERLYSKVSTRKILMQLIEVCLKLHDVASASQYQQEFISIAPDDFYRYIYQYNIDKLSGKPVEVLIDSLEQLKSLEYIDIWAYELAKLYHKAGLRDKCIKECDDIVVWFGDGDIVERAKALRAYYLGELELEEQENAADESGQEAGEAEATEQGFVADVAEIAADGQEIAAGVAETAADGQDEETAETETEDAQQLSFGDMIEVTAGDTSVLPEVQTEDEDEQQLSFGDMSEVSAEQTGNEDEQQLSFGDMSEVSAAQDEAEDEQQPSFGDMSEVSAAQDEAEDEQQLSFGDMSEVSATQDEAEDEQQPSFADMSEVPAGQDETVDDEQSSYEDMNEVSAGQAETSFTEEVNESAEPDDIKIDQDMIDGEDFDFSSSLASMVGMFMDEDKREAEAAEAATETESAEDTAEAGPEAIEDTAPEEIVPEAEPEVTETTSSEQPDDTALSDREQAEIEVEQALLNMIEEETRMANGEDEPAAEPAAETVPEPEPVQTDEPEPEPAEDATSCLDLESMFAHAPAPAEGSLLDTLIKDCDCDARDFFGGFAFIESVRSQIYKCMEILLDSKYKNRSLIVSGLSTRERTVLSRCVVKALYMADILEEQRIAKTTGVKACHSNILGGNEHIRKCGLMIDVAGRINAETAKKLLSFRDVYGPSSMIILMDSQNEINRIFREYDGLAATFTNRIHIPVPGVEDLYTLALYELYAEGLAIESDAARALRQRVSDLASSAGDGVLSAVLELADNIREKVSTRNARMLIANAMKDEALSGGSQPVTVKDVND